MPTSVSFILDVIAIATHPDNIHVTIVNGIFTHNKYKIMMEVWLVIIFRGFRRCCGECCKWLILKFKQNIYGNTYQSIVTSSDSDNVSNADDNIDDDIYDTDDSDDGDYIDEARDEVTNYNIEMSRY